ncbi:unannotated protein [freshwater metagenome]|uniref:Unannotated protein n=1 Tax=freshwater metagenome TaxID=449393 RepID=A0A6J6KPQ4_9ZZZZ
MLGGILISSTQTKHHVCLSRTRGPHLLARDHDLVTINFSTCLERCQVRTCIGFRKSLAVSIRAVNDARKKSLLLLICTPHNDGRPHKPFAHTASETRHIGARKLLIHHRNFYSRESSTAIFLWPRHTHVPRLSKCISPFTSACKLTTLHHVGRQTQQLFWRIGVQPCTHFFTKLLSSWSQI